MRMYLKRFMKEFKMILFILMPIEIFQQLVRGLLNIDILRILILFSVKSD